MAPVGLSGSGSTGWTILFRCTQCGAERRNRAAHDDPVQPDRWEAIVELSARGGEKRSSRKRPEVR